MVVSATQNFRKEWSIVTDDGEFMAEVVDMKNVTISEGTVRGEFVTAWGVTLDADSPALPISKPIYQVVGDLIKPTVRRAKRALLDCSGIHALGVAYG